MASTTFRLSIGKVLDKGVIEGLEAEIGHIAAQHGLNLSVEVVEPSFTYKIMQDQYPQNPREDWDNIGVMFCKHSRYRLGDKNADDPTVTRRFVMLDGYKLYCEHCDDVGDPPEGVTTYEEVEGMLVDHLFDMRWDVDATESDLRIAKGALEYLEGATFAPNSLIANSAMEVEGELREDIAICLPIYLYAHGGITVSHGAFSCKWDSGQVGWHYITREKLQDEFGGDVERATKCLEAELRVYDAYLRGSVWGYTIEDEEGDEVGSCCGLYGDTLEETGLLSDVDAEHVAGLTEAWDRRFE